MACGNDQVREGPFDRGQGRIFMCRVGIGMQEDNRDGFDLLVDQGLHLGQQVVFVQRCDDGAVRTHALADFKPQVPWGQRLWHRDEQVIQFVFPFAPDFQHVPEAVGCNQAGARALAFDQRVGEQGRRMDDPVQ